MLGWLWRLLIGRFRERPMPCAAHRWRVTERAVLVKRGDSVHAHAQGVWIAQICRDCGELRSKELR